MCKERKEVAKVYSFDLSEKMMAYLEKVRTQGEIAEVFHLDRKPYIAG
jgi:hypothetical protein